jgi:hypothetical protein
MSAFYVCATTLQYSSFTGQQMLESLPCTSPNPDAVPGL